jgi:alpha-1,6-mannosyltransferase
MTQRSFFAQGQRRRPYAAVSATALTLAMAVVVGAWLMLGPVARRVPAGRLYAVAAWWALPLMLARPLFSGDVWSYLTQGLITAGGRDPYLLGPAQALGTDSPVTQHVSHF